jgi:outer membrane protein assembly factor BamB
MTWTLAVWLACSGLACSLFRSRPAPYPEGVIFPLAQTATIEFEGRAVRSLVKGGGKLYFATDKGVLFCLDEHGGRVLWKYEASSALGCPPAVGPRIIAVRDTADTVFGISPDGALIWKIKLRGTASSDIFLAEDRLYVGTREGFLYALSTSKGEVLWEFETGGAVEAGCVAWYDSVVLASTDGRVYFLGHDGKLRGRWEAGAAIRVTPVADGDCLYFGADDDSFSCLDLKSRERKWRLRLEGRILSAPRADEKSVYFTASNTVLYALNKSNGNIKWWRILPSRSPFSQEISLDKILATSSSSVLVGLDRTTGEEKGRYDASLEVRSNPVWSAPDILVALYDSASDKGSLVQLQKAITVELSALPPLSAGVGAEVVFTASPVGFYLPKYEFYIRSGAGRTVAREASDRNSWTWFPDKEGKVTIGVKVSDAKETRESEMVFEVTKPKEAAKPKEVTVPKEVTKAKEVTKPK